MVADDRWQKLYLYFLASYPMESEIDGARLNLDTTNPTTHDALPDSAIYAHR
jgi:hypothetical protein